MIRIKLVTMFVLNMTALPRRSFHVSLSLLKSRLRQQCMLFPALIRRSFHSTPFISNKLFRMAAYSNAHFRHKEGCETFDFTFFVEHSDLRVSRNFNFSRRITESVGEFQSRILTNLEKTVQKKNKKKKQDKCEQTEPVITISFRADGDDLDSNSNFKEVLSSGLNVTMHILGLDFKVLVNTPVIKSLGLSESLLVGFPICPNKLDIDFGERRNCQMTWYLSSIEVTDDNINRATVKFEEVASSYSYTPNPSDVNRLVKLKCVPHHGDLQGPTVEAFSKNVISAGPGHCPFDTRHQFTKEFLSGSKFRIMSYNILADFYTDSDYSREVLFPYCPPYALAIDYRKQLIFKEIAGYKADLICLQEVDRKIFNCDLQPCLEDCGYSGLFSKKEGQVDEGIACFYRNDSFRLEEHECITLSPEITSNPLFEEILKSVNNNEALKSRMLDRGTILQMLVLRHLSTGHLLVVGTTHLYFHPDADHIRLLQAAACLSYLQQKHMALQKENEKCSLILCGDFNSTPEFGVYKLMTEGHIPKDYADWQSNENEVVKDLELKHNFKLSSACGCPKYTNYTVGFADCLDYIFYQTDFLKVSQVVPLPSDEELQQYTAIPSVVQPSDHVALVADLEITIE